MSLVPHDAITEIVDARDGALERAQRAAELLHEAHALIAEANDLAVRAHGGQPFMLGDREYEAFKGFTEHSNVANGLAAWRKTQDARVWMHLAERTGMREAMDHEAKQAFRASLERSVPEVTLDSVWASVSGAREEQALYFRRGLANAFSALDRRFKSHDAYKFGSRIIIDGLFEPGAAYWNYHRSRDELLQDIERCFAVLAGDTPCWSRFRDELLEARRQSVHERIRTKWFDIRCFFNGNVHLYPHDRALVDMVNRELAAYYGAVLPDAVRPDVDPRDARSQTGALSKDLAFYPTPKAAAEKAVEYLFNNWYPSAARVLEPSAGEGHLALELLRVTDDKREANARECRRFPHLGHEVGWDVVVDAVEVHPGRVAALRQMARRYPGLNVREANFLQLTPTGDYDAVLMNPPFYGTHCLEHVMHAFDFLKPGGRLAAILPATAQVRETKKHKAFAAWLKGKSARWWDLPAESFAESGTRVATVVLTLGRRF